MHQAFSEERVPKKYFSYFSTKTYVVGTQKNHLNEMVLLRIQTYVQTDGLENIYNFTLKNFVYLNLEDILTRAPL